MLSTSSVSPWLFEVAAPQWLSANRSSDGAAYRVYWDDKAEGRPQLSACMGAGMQPSLLSRAWRARLRVHRSCGARNLGQVVQSGASWPVPRQSHATVDKLGCAEGGGRTAEVPKAAVPGGFDSRSRSRSRSLSPETAAADVH